MGVICVAMVDDESDVRGRGDVEASKPQSGPRVMIRLFQPVPPSTVMRTGKNGCSHCAQSFRGNGRFL